MAFMGKSYAKCILSIYTTKCDMKRTRQPLFYSVNNAAAVFDWHQWFGLAVFLKYIYRSALNSAWSCKSFFLSVWLRGLYKNARMRRRIKREVIGIFIKIFKIFVYDTEDALLRIFINKYGFIFFSWHQRISHGHEESWRQDGYLHPK